MVSLRVKVKKRKHQVLARMGNNWSSPYLGGSVSQSNYSWLTYIQSSGNIQSAKPNICTPTKPAISPWCIEPSRNAGICSPKDVCSNVHGTSIRNSPKLETFQMPMRSRTDEKEVWPLTRGMGWQLKWANFSDMYPQGLCTTAVISHHEGSGARVTACLGRPILGPTKQATVYPLSPRPVLFPSQHFSWAEPTSVCLLCLCLEHRLLASLVHCRVSGTWALPSGIVTQLIWSFYPQNSLHANVCIGYIYNCPKPKATKMSSNSQMDK